MADYKAGKVSVWIQAQRGIVRGERQWSETTTSSSGFVGGVADPFRISSSTEYYHTFWIVSSNQREIEIHAPEGFRCREGQEVLLFWGAREISLWKGKRMPLRGKKLCIFNVNSGGVGSWLAGQRILGDPKWVFIKESIKYFLILYIFKYIYNHYIIFSNFINRVCEYIDGIFPDASSNALGFYLALGFVLTLWRLWRNRKLSLKVLNEALRRERRNLEN